MVRNIWTKSCSSGRIVEHGLGNKHKDGVLNAPHVKCFDSKSPSLQAGLFELLKHESTHKSLMNTTPPLQVVSREQFLSEPLLTEKKQEKRRRINSKLL